MLCELFSIIPVQAKEDKSVLDARVGALQRKWSDICKRLHSSSTSQEDMILAKPHTSSVPSFLNRPVQKDIAGAVSLSIGSRVATSDSQMSSDLQKNSLPKKTILKPVVLSADVNAQAELPSKGFELNHLWNLSSFQQKMSMPNACTSSPSDSSFTTDLTLATVYKSAEECRRKPNLKEDYNGIQNSESSRSHEKIGIHKKASQVNQPLSCSHHLGKQVYTKDLEHPWKVLSEKVHWQIEAIQTISRTVSCFRNGNGRYRCSNRRDIWLSFMGPDKMGKRSIASAVAEIVFGRKENFISLDLSPQDMIRPFNSIIDSYDANYHKLKGGRKMIVDYLADELSKHPHSVVLLENVEKADFLVRDSLFQAMKTGKLTDSHGRDININNTIFVLASTVLTASQDMAFGKVAFEFLEENVLEAKNYQMQILVGSADGICNMDSATNVSVTPGERISDQSPYKKRRLINDDLKKADILERDCRLSKSIIDLNLPVEDTEEDSDVDESDNSSENSEAWLHELLEHVDENVVFKPFDFDSLAREILKKINVQLKKLVGATILLEIDRAVMVQILAAAWLTDCKNALGDWIDQVLCSSIEETRQRCNVTSVVVMKLVPCDGLAVEVQASGVCLPARINMK